MGDDGHTAELLLPEWSDGGEVDDAIWIAALEESRRRQFAELTNL